MDKRDVEGGERAKQSQESQNSTNPLGEDPLHNTDTTKKRKFKDGPQEDPSANLSTKAVVNKSLPITNGGVVSWGGMEGSEGSSSNRKESHKIIEQKRRQKINDKINELRDLLNYPDGSHNKAVVLQAAVDNIKNLKLVCSKLLASHRQLQEDYLNILVENERITKLRPPHSTQQYEPLHKLRGDSEDMTGQQQQMEQGGAGGSAGKKKGVPNSSSLERPDLSMSFLYDEIPSLYSSVASMSNMAAISNMGSLSSMGSLSNLASMGSIFSKGYIGNSTRDFGGNGPSSNGVAYGQDWSSIGSQNLSQGNCHIFAQDQDQTVRT